MNKLTDLHLLILEKGTINCDDVVDVMGDYIDGDLTASIKDRIESHMAGCAECREFLRTYSFTVKLAASLRNDDPVPTDVQNRLRASLNARLGLSLPQVSE